MKTIFKICLFLIGAAGFHACDDPYQDQTFTVNQVQPISSYLETRPGDFSEWIKVLKYADMYNAINQANGTFTAFVPDNRAVQKFYEDKNVSSIEELGATFARQLVQYHVINDSNAVDVDKLAAGGALTVKNLSGDFLDVVFDDSNVGEDQGFGSSIYINGEAHVSELAISTTNGLVYVLEDVMRPMIETAYEKMRETGMYNVMCEALVRTGWRDSLDIIADTLQLPDGLKQETRRYYTVLAVTDDVFAGQGINTVDDLVSKLGAGTDYTAYTNELNRYVSYHIINSRNKLADLINIPAGTSCRLLQTACPNTLIKLTAGGTLNQDEGAQRQARLVATGSDLQAKNGFIQQVDGYMPIPVKLQPVPFYWEPTDYPEVANYIVSNGVEGQVYKQTQGVDNDKELTTDLKDAGLSCYKLEPGTRGYPPIPGGDIPIWRNFSYHTYRGTQTADPNHTDRTFMNGDMLDISLGYNGSVTMDIPAIIPGKYKVTLRYFFANSLRAYRWYGYGSSGGLTKFEFTALPGYEVEIPLYSRLPADYNKITYSTTTGAITDIEYKITQGLEDVTLFEEIDFTTMQEHPFKITLVDYAADNSESVNYRIQLDYILFEPIQ